MTANKDLPLTIEPGALVALPEPSGGGLKTQDYLNRRDQQPIEDKAIRGTR